MLDLAPNSGTACSHIFKHSCNQDQIFLCLLGSIPVSTKFSLVPFLYPLSSPRFHSCTHLVLLGSIPASTGSPWFQSCILWVPWFYSCIHWVLLGSIPVSIGFLSSIPASTGFPLVPFLCPLGSPWFHSCIHWVLSLCTPTPKHLIKGALNSKAVVWTLSTPHHLASQSFLQGSADSNQSKY